MIVEEKLKTSKQNPADNFTEMLPGDLALEMVAIPAGEFMMGSDGYDDLKHDYYLQYIPDHDAASPIHKVKVPAFHMGKYPITQAQYEAVMGNNPSFDYNTQGHMRKQYYDTHKNYPVEQVNWNMAQEFCQKLSEITGKKYQLPTESQWEYACRAGTTTRYFFGEKHQYLKKYAHANLFQHFYYVDKKDIAFQEYFMCCYTLQRTLDRNNDYILSPDSSNDYRMRCTLETKSYKPNPWGLHDLLGNVWEWCQDDWIDGYYRHPSDGSAVNTESDVKVVRGGCFESSQNDCCSFSRSSRDINIAYKTLGFRVVCVP